MEEEKYRFTDLKHWAHNWMDVQPSLYSNNSNATLLKSLDATEADSATHGSVSTSNLYT